MERINLGRVLLGGIVAGIVMDVLGFLVDGVMLAPQWANAMKALGRPETFTTTQIMGFNLIGIASGIFVVWMYAAIRTRYGAGPKTAVLTGVGAWVIGVLLPNVGLASIGLFPTDLTMTSTVAAVVEWSIAALAGAALYKEAEGSARSMTARA